MGHHLPLRNRFRNYEDLLLLRPTPRRPILLHQLHWPRYFLPYQGIFLALANVLMALSYFYRILFPFKNLVNGYFVQVSLSAIFLLFVPLSMIMKLHLVSLSMIAFSLFGWFQGSSYATLAGLLSQRFAAEEDGCLLGAWGSAGDAGNLLGLFLFTSVVYYLKWDWKFCIIIPAILSLVANSMLKYFLRDNLERERSEG